jgi:hypothetical protein
MVEMREIWNVSSYRSSRFSVIFEKDLGRFSRCLIQLPIKAQ